MERAVPYSRYSVSQLLIGGVFYFLDGPMCWVFASIFFFKKMVTLDACAIAGRRRRLMRPRERPIETSVHDGHALDQRLRRPTKAASRSPTDAPTS